ncbi:MAG: c-type cytochrome [Gammaproteobacteria bacterium]|nr:c-type cytochrome [Gammaproteobacteria bacterium]
MSRILFVSVLLSSALLSACQSESGPLAPRGALTEEAEIGKSLFFDTRLSNPAGQSCASCHSPQHGFAEPDQHLPVSQGANPAHFGNRNAPSTAYAAFSPAFYFAQEEGLYIGGQFVDGRAATPEAQAIQPLLNPIEMNNANAEAVVSKVRQADYAEQIRRHYGAQALDDIDRAMTIIGQAITAYERSQEMVPFSSKYDLYLAGKLSLSTQEMRGLKVFESENKGNCAACHPNTAGKNGTAPLFTDFSYDNLGVPGNKANPFYMMPARYNPAASAYVDRGLGEVLNKRSEDGKFKVPSLRNIALTAPYMHNGVFASLQEVVEFYNSRDTDKRWEEPEVAANVNAEELGDLKLTEQEQADLLAFLQTLSDGYTGQ